MDFRRLLTTILIAGAVWIAVMFLTKSWSGNKPDQARAATMGAQTQYYTPAPAALPSEHGAVARTVRLGDPQKDSKDKLAITVDNVSAGIDRVELNVNDYAEHVQDRQHPNPQPLVLLKAADGIAKPYSTLRIHIQRANAALPDDIDVSHYIWSMDDVPANSHEVRLHLSFAAGGWPWLEITKVFATDPASYDVKIWYEVKNLGDAPAKVAIDQMAATDLPLDKTQSDDRFYHAAGLDEAAKSIKEDRFNFTHAEFAALDKAGGTREIGKFTGTDPLEWVASSGRFFVAITRPTQNGGRDFTLFDGRKIPIINHVNSASIDILQRGVAAQEAIGGMRLNGALVEIPAAATASMPLAVFFGPKKADILKGDIHADPHSEAFARAVYRYSTIIQFKSGSCAAYSFCTWDWLGNILVWLLNFLCHYVTFGNFGFAIIILTIIIRAILHPLTRASQVNMATMGKKMKDIQPLIEANKKKYAKDKTKQNEEMMRIYREHNVNPAGGLMGCLPMMIQMPIWIAMWSSLRTDIDLYHARFIPGWINDLSAPDMTVTFAPFHLPLVGWEVSALNVLPLLLGIVFFIQMQVQTASQPKPADDQQAAMQNMTKYMSLMFPLFLYNLPSGLNLYYFASTLSGLVDTYFVRKTLKRKGILPANAKALPTHEEREE